MAYNPKSDLNELVYLKGRYTDGDDATKKWASESAAKYYQNLMDNGYSGLASQYKNMDYNTAYNDYKTNYAHPEEKSDYNSKNYIKTLRDNANTMLDAEFQKMQEYYKREMDKTNERYNDAKKDSYFDYMKENQHINQKLGANGITGGAAESTIAAGANNYLSGLNSLDKEKNNAISDIEAEQRAAYYDQIARKAQNEIDFAREGRSAFESDRNFKYGQLRDDISDSQWQRSFDNEKEWRGKEFDETQKMNEHNKWMDGQTVDYNNNMLSETKKMNNHNVWMDGQTVDYNNRDQLYTQAISMAQLGNFEPLANLLGISTEEALNRYKNLVAYENSFKSGGKGGANGYYETINYPEPSPKATNTVLDYGLGPIAGNNNINYYGFDMGDSVKMGNGFYNAMPDYKNYVYSINLNNAGKNLEFISE